MTLFSGLIYFDVGMKNPKIILDNQQFLMHRRDPDQTVWMCNKYFNKREIRCKVKLITSGRVVKVYGEHTHEIKSTNGKHKNMLSQHVTIIRIP